jgi:hypothetical protein
MEWRHSVAGGGGGEGRGVEKAEKENVSRDVSGEENTCEKGMRHAVSSGWRGAGRRHG